MLVVSDNGSKAVPESSGAGGIGMTTMQQRAKAIGASLDFYHHQYGNVVTLVVRK